MSRRFCAICGKDIDETAPHVGMCMICYAKEHPLFELPGKFTIKICIDCGSYTIKEEWVESQEKEIREKEARIHRLEFLSFMYRASKFFGGILIILGIIFIILSIGYLVNIVNFGDANNFFVFIFLIIAAGGSILSGVFHLEKS